MNICVCVYIFRSRLIIKIFVIRHQITCDNINVPGNCIFAFDVDFGDILFTFHMERFLETFTNLAFVIIIILSSIRLYSVAVCCQVSGLYISVSNMLAWR